MSYRKFSNVVWAFSLALVLGGVLWAFSGPTGAHAGVAAAAPLAPNAGPLASIAILGPTSGQTSVVYTFTTQISPTDATRPITYTWSPTPLTGQGTATATYSWGWTGSKTISVTATNLYYQYVSDVHMITIGQANTPVEWVSISGPESGRQHVTYHFSATVNLTATTPITYVWSPMPESGQGTRYAAYSWDDAGNHTISVTASNAYGWAIDYLFITIENTDVPVQSVNIAGPLTVTVGHSYNFTAMTSPVSATAPITYVWTPEPSSGQGTATATYSWDDPGAKIIEVRVGNGIGYAYDAHSIFVEGIPVDSVDIDGPDAGLVGTQYSFSTEVNPITATEPISYVWDPAPYSGQGMATAIYSWDVAGVKHITVTAENANGLAISSHTITIANIIIPLTLVQISGPAIGAINTVYTFTTIITPANATTPIAYQWTPAPINGQGTATATYSWANVGEQSILVIAENEGGYASDSHVINITTGGIPIDSVKISGPSAGKTNATLTFTATISPADAEKPVVYTWSPAPNAGQGTANASYIWNAAGYKVITVKASNGSSHATATKTLFIVASNTAVQSVEISGPIFGIINIPFNLTALITPPDATTPITYTWSPEPYSGQGAATATYSWSVASKQTITVTVNNGSGPVGDTHTMLIKSDRFGILYLPTVLRAFTSVAPPIPLQQVKIAGPVLGRANTEYNFTAPISPPDATAPITYTWTPTPTAGQGAATATYSWTVTGTMVITVTAWNEFSSAENSHAITIADGKLSVEIVGPPQGKVNIPYSFMATISPTNAATPITYIWEPTPAGVQGTATAAYIWDTPGAKVISVTADNGISIATDVHVITITNASILSGPAATAGPDAVQVPRAKIEPSATARPAATPRFRRPAAVAAQ